MSYKPFFYHDMADKYISKEKENDCKLNHIESGRKSKFEQMCFDYYEKLSKYRNNKYVKLYFYIFIGLNLLFFIRGLIPKDIVNNYNYEEMLKITKYATIPYKYKPFNVIPYRQIISSKELIEKYKYEKISDFEIETDKDAYFQQNTQLKQLYKEMMETIQANKFSCLSSIHLGVPFNILMLADSSVLINPIIDSCSEENITVEEYTAFDQYNGKSVNRSKNVNIKYLNGKTLKLESKFFDGAYSICIQSHLSDYLY